MESDGSPDPAGATTTADDARAALALVDLERRAVAARVRAVRWYAPLYGVVMSVLVLAPAAPLPLLGVVSGLALLALAGLVTAYRRVTGLWVSPASPDAPRGPVLAVAGVALGAFAVVVLATHVWHAPGVAVATAVLAGVVAASLSRAFDLRWAANVERG